MSTLKVAAIQTAPDFGAYDRNITDALASIPAGCDLAVLPELFASGYQFRSRDEVRQLSDSFDLPAEPASAFGRLLDHAQRHDCTIVAGLAERSGDALYNSSVLVRPDGTREVYRKVHLFSDEKLVFTPGDLGFPVFAACGTEVGMMVCFDWLFPESARSLALAGARVLCHPSNLVLPWCPQAMITRCLENRVFALTANRIGTEHRTGEALTFIGLSQVVSPGGDVLIRLGSDEPGVAAAEIDPGATDKQVTPRNHLWRDRRPDAYRL